MKIRFLLLAVACLLAHFASAQSVPSRLFMLGPVIGFKKVDYIKKEDDLLGPSVYIPTGIYGGIDGSYQVNRWLFGAKLLYQKITYQSTPSEFTSGSSPYRLLREDSDYRIVTVPLSVGYRLAGTTRFQWYIGGAVMSDLIIDTGNETRFTTGGIQTTTNDATRPTTLSLGYGAQTTVRYTVSPNVTLQLEPSVQYNSKAGFPLRLYSNYQFRGAFSLLFKV
ncbi:MAG: hypothetical protein EOO39_07325 [Cytophagaceae bacterium]|nr:MAG: hypothetical protein EOO39_07325 [Cytophagaceae bacterium]